MDKTENTYLDMLVHFNIIPKLLPMLEAGRYIIDAETKKIRVPIPSIDASAPWVFVNPSPEMFCHLFRLTFDHWNFIHSRCMECFKVVVKMPAVVDLFKMLEWQRQFTEKTYGTDRFCKCGIEKRPWVHYQYGAYFYCKGIEQGKLRHHQVMDGLRACYGEDRVSSTPGAVGTGKVEVILKRYCTEFELKLGPTDVYERPPLSDEMEKRIMDAFERVKNLGQPDFLVHHIMEEWLRFAWEIGDDSAKQFNGGLPFYTPVVTYHEKER